MSKSGDENGSAPLSLRPVRPEDEPFLYEVYASTRLDELAPLQWDDVQRESFLRMQFQAQQHHYLTRFPDASYQVILRDDTPVGRIYVHKREDHIQILDVSILPEHRNAGIGTALISDVLVKAARLSVPVRIYVESFNRSLRLFERLGFSKVDESSIHFLLEWRPQV